MESSGSTYFIGAYMLRQWSEFLKRSLRMLVGFGALPPINVEARIVLPKGARWAAAS